MNAHVVDYWTDRTGKPRTTCAACEDPWPCSAAPANGRPAGYLRPGRAAVDRIVAEVAHGFDVSVDDILGRGSQRHVFVARACAMAVIRRSTNWSTNVIGEYFGRDHTTVSSAVDRVMGDPELCRAVEQVVAVLEPAPALFAVPQPMWGQEGLAL